MIFRFGSFELDEEAGELRRDGAAVAVQPKPLELLRLLLRERQRVVPLDELFTRLWPGTAVTPGSLTRAVSHARRAIGDTHKGALIRSYSRRGYRFCGDVVQVEGSPRSAPDDARDASAPGEPGGAFVGRADALQRLRQAWGQVAAGQGTIALVSGRAGIGKTRLVEVFAREMERRGPQVLVGRCRDGEGVPAFWLWAQILRQLLAEESLRSELSELVDRTGELASLVPELAGGEGGPARAALSPEQSRFLLFDAVARALSRASRRRPLLLVLEDLQWARSASLRLLEHLAFETAGDPILLLATVRDELRDRGHPLNRTLAILRQQDRCAQIALAGFTRRDVAALLEGVLGRPAPSDLTSELYARSEGVPLFLREAIRILSERGELRHPERIARHGVQLPAQALDLIRRSLDALSEPCADLVAAASVIGREFGLPLLASVAELSRDRALDLLDEAIRAGVVEEAVQLAGSYRFGHALFQEASYESLSPGSRARLHLRVASRLEQQVGEDLDGVIAELAHHHHQGIAVGDPARAFDLARRAAERAAAVYAYEQAAAHWEQAAAALEHFEVVPPNQRLETLLALGEAYRLAGDRARRRQVFSRAMGSARALGRNTDFARAAIGFCDLSEWGVRDAEAEAAVREGLARLGREPGVERVRLTTRFAYLVALGSREQAEPVARKAVELARDSGDPNALQEALYALHFAIGGPDHLDERTGLVKEVVATARSASIRDPALIALLDVACDRLTVGDRAGAQRLRAEAVQVAGENPHLGLVWHMGVYDTGLALLEGRFEEVEALARKTYGMGQRIAHPYAFGCWNAHRARLAWERGDPEGLVALMQPALRARQGPTFWVQAVVARAHVAAGRHDDGRSLFDRMAEGGFDDVPRNLRWVGTLVELAELCADLGDARRAKRLREVLGPAAGHQGVLPMAVCYGGPVAASLARLCEMLGEGEEAAELYQEALDSAVALGARPARARVGLAYGAFCARRGDRRRARGLLEEGARGAEELGMPTVAQQARSLLEDLRL